MLIVLSWSVDEDMLLPILSLSPSAVDVSDCRLSMIIGSNQWGRGFAHHWEMIMIEDESLWLICEDGSDCFTNFGDCNLV